MIIETGAGVRNANSYVNIAYVDAYLTTRNRESENNWLSRTEEQKEAAIIAATDYVEKRFGHRFVGIPKFTFEETFSKARLTFSGLPGSSEIFTLGDETYKFVSSLTGEINEIVIGSSVAETVTNLESAINATGAGGAVYGLGTTASRHASALAAGAVLTLTSLANGAGGNLSALSGTVTNMVITAFSGGRDGGIQPLHFPATGGYDAHGNEIVGVPDRLKKAISEYAVRAVSSSLLPDLSTDPYGGRINQRTETVGPITESVRYDSGSMGSFQFKPFPAADKLLSPLLSVSYGRVIRG